MSFKSLKWLKNAVTSNFLWKCPLPFCLPINKYSRPPWASGDGLCPIDLTSLTYYVSSSLELSSSGIYPTVSNVAALVTCYCWYCKQLLCTVLESKSSFQLFSLFLLAWVSSQSHHMLRKLLHDSRRWSVFTHVISSHIKLLKQKKEFA